MKLSSLSRSMCLALAFLGASCGSHNDEKPKMTATSTVKAADVVKANPDALAPEAIAKLENDNIALAGEKAGLVNQIKDNEKKREQASKIIKGDGIGGILGTIIGTIFGGPNIIQNIADALTNKDGKKAIELINKANADAEVKIKACDAKIKENEDKIAKAKAV